VCERDEKHLWENREELKFTTREEDSNERRKKIDLFECKEESKSFAFNKFFLALPARLSPLPLLRRSVCTRKILHHLLSVMMKIFLIHSFFFSKRAGEREKFFVVMRRINSGMLRHI
jgi:hypothetical protein